MEPRQPRGPRIVEYDAVVRAHVDRKGNLRLYRRRRLWVVQTIFHPAGEWRTVSVDRTAHALVQLTR
jgi:hypothetical protein